MAETSSLPLIEIFWMSLKDLLLFTWAICIAWPNVNLIHLVESFGTLCIDHLGNKTWIRGGSLWNMRSAGFIALVADAWFIVIHTYSSAVKCGTFFCRPATMCPSWAGKKLQTRAHTSTRPCCFFQSWVVRRVIL